MGKSRVPASKAMRTPKSEKPQSTILAEEAMLLVISTVTNSAITISK